VILSKEKDQLHAVRDPNELMIEADYEIHLANGISEVQFAKIESNS